MTIRHHPDALLLARLAAGSLPRAFVPVMRAHMHLCSECRMDLSVLEAAGGAMLGAMPPAVMDDAALAHALARIDTMPHPDEAPAPAAAKSLGFGLSYRPLYWDEHSGARAYELHVPAGVKVPMHSHRGMELTCIVRGSFADQSGNFGPGDFIVADETLRHSPRAGVDGECICIVGSEGPLKMEGILARAYQLYSRL